MYLTPPPLMEDLMLVQSMKTQSRTVTAEDSIDHRMQSKVTIFKDAYSIIWYYNTRSCSLQQREKWKVMCIKAPHNNNIESTKTWAPRYCLETFLSNQLEYWSCRSMLTEEHSHVSNNRCLNEIWYPINFLGIQNLSTVSNRQQHFI